MPDQDERAIVGHLLLQWAAYWLIAVILIVLASGALLHLPR